MEYRPARRGGGYIYLGLITGEHPDPDRAAKVINALLPIRT